MTHKKEDTKANEVLKLLETGAAKSTEIGEVLGGHRHALSGTLSAMHKQGLIISDGGRPATYRLPTEEEARALASAIGKNTKKKKTNGKAHIKEESSQDTEAVLRAALSINEILDVLSTEGKNKVLKLVAAMNLTLSDESELTVLLTRGDSA